MALALTLNPSDTREDRISFYAKKLGECFAVGGPELMREAERALCLSDLFYLLVKVLKRKDVNKDWLYERCQEVQREPNGRLDLWSREHYKSTIITFGLTVQDILRDPEVTVGLFSHTRPAAKKPLRQIMNEFERNEELKGLFSDILWADPRKEAPRWSEDNGLVVRRTNNPKEATVEAWGLIDAMPTGSHFKLMVYDDVIDANAVSSPDMIRKVIERWELSINLGARGGASRIIGTKYSANDPYAEILRRGSAIRRFYPATKDGTVEGEPVLLTRAELTKKRRDMGPFTFAAQMMQDPSSDRKQGFLVDWLQHAEDRNEGANLNRYLLVDPASEKKRESDYTTMGVIGLGPDRNYYLLDMIRDRLNLVERREALFTLHRRWRPKSVGYEKYGMQCDIEHMQEHMRDANYRFEIIPLGGQMAKPDRIRRLIPIFEEKRFYLPEKLFKTDYEGRVVDLVQSFIEEEYKSFPVGLHDDMFDMIARIVDPDLNAIWPKDAVPEQDRYAKKRVKRRTYSAWAA